MNVKTPQQLMKDIALLPRKLGVYEKQDIGYLIHERIKAKKDRRQKWKYTWLERYLT